MTSGFDLAKAERAVLKAKADMDTSEQRRAAYEVQGLTRFAQLAAKHRKKTESRLARAVAELQKLRGDSAG